MSHRSLVQLALLDPTFQTFQRNPLNKLHLHRRSEKDNFKYLIHPQARFLLFAPGHKPAIINQRTQDKDKQEQTQSASTSLSATDRLLGGSFLVSPLLLTLSELSSFAGDLFSLPSEPNVEIPEEPSERAQLKIGPVQSGFVEPVMLGVGCRSLFRLPTNFDRVSHEQPSEHKAAADLDSYRLSHSLASEPTPDQFIYFALSVPSAAAAATLASRVNEAIQPPLKLSQIDPNHSFPGSFTLEFGDLRSTLPYLTAFAASILGQARALLEWHSNSQHCGKCGAKTIVNGGGSKRVCLGCLRTSYPRTDCVTIALVRSRDHSRVLLGRKKEFPAGVFTCLAGFLEGGEAIEEGVQREIFEESGVLVDPSSVQYFQSQPWPFLGGQLMIGCFATAATEQIQRHDDELEEVKFFTRQEVGEMLKQSRTRADLWNAPRGSKQPSNGPAVPLRVPPPYAIAHQLIQQWYTTSTDSIDSSSSPVSDVRC